MQPFSILLGLGTLAGLLLAGWHAPKKETIRYVDAGVFALFIAVIGSRAAYVAINWGYYTSHPGEIYQVWLGGLSGVGALAGGVLAVLILALVWKFPAGLLADILFPLAGTLCITSWLGCWVATCAYGAPSTAWWALPGWDEWGVLASRLPIQLIGAILTLVLLWLIDQSSKHMPVAGLSADIGLFGISSVIFALSYFRADPVPIWHGLRLEAWGALCLIALSIFLLVVLLIRCKLSKPPVPHRRVT
jgi:prolipoprotein diacylglyceryltransferase